MFKLKRSKGIHLRLVARGSTGALEHFMTDFYGL